MSLGLRLLARLPNSLMSSEQLLSHLEAWLKSKYAPMRPLTTVEVLDSSPSLLCKLHPAAEEIELSLIAPGQLVVSANTTTVGPGYHVFLTALLKDLAEEIDSVWEVPSADSDEFGDETGFFFSGDTPRLQAEMTAWLAALAKSFFDGTLDVDAHGIALCLPMNPQFESSQLAITPLGPREREWLRRTAIDGNQGTDFFAWWESGFTSHYYLGRALAHMWTDVRWRIPVSSQEELVLEDVAGCLKTAYEIDPSLDYPWAEWKQLLALLGGNRPEIAVVEAKAPATPTIGYRRKNVRVKLPGGWSIRVPGSFTEFEVDEQGNLFSIDPPREVWFTAYRLEDASLRSFKAVKNDMQKKRSDEVIDREDYFAQAEVSERRWETGERYFVLKSSSLRIGARCVCTILFSTPDEKSWALDTWRSLQPPQQR